MFLDSSVSACYLPIRILQIHAMVSHSKYFSMYENFIHSHIWSYSPQFLPYSPQPTPPPIPTTSFYYLVIIKFHLITKTLILFTYLFIFNDPSTPICDVHVLVGGCEANHWSMVDLPGATSLKKTGFPPKSHQPSVATQVGWGPYEPLPTPC